MYYYKYQGTYYTSNKPLKNWNEVSAEEYLTATTPTEAEIRAEKEAQLRALMNELYPVED